MKEGVESVKQTGESIASDLKGVGGHIRNVIKDDLDKATDRVIQGSEAIDQTVRKTNQTQNEVANEAAKRAKNEDEKYVLSQHAENPFNKAAKMAHDAKEAVMDTFRTSKGQPSPQEKANADAHQAQQTKNNLTEPPASVAAGIEGTFGNIEGKIKSAAKAVKETIVGKSPDKPSEAEDPMVAARTDPMGQEQTPSTAVPPLDPETEKLRQKGAQHKREEDHFNLK
jgi:hypothetical protein